MPGKPDEGLSVLLGGRRVGTLAEMPDGLVAFQYDAEWLRSGFSVNSSCSPRSGVRGISRRAGST